MDFRLASLLWSSLFLVILSESLFYLIRESLRSPCSCLLSYGPLESSTTNFSISHSWMGPGQTSREVAKDEAGDTKRVRWDELAAGEFFTSQAGQEMFIDLSGIEAKDK